MPTPTDDLVKKIEREVGPLIQGKAKKQVLGRVNRILQQQVTYKGPIPPPDMFAGYEAAVPGSGDRILSMAERSLDHDCYVHRQAQIFDKEDRRLGMFLGFWTICVLTGAAVLCALYDHQIFAGGLVLVEVGGLVGYFVNGRQNNKRDDD